MNEPVDPQTVNWEKVRSGEIEAPPKIVPPERDCKDDPPNEGGVIWIWRVGRLQYYGFHEGFGTRFENVAAEYSNDGVLLRVNAPEPVPWESVEDWGEPPMLVRGPVRGERAFHHYGRVAHDPVWGWEYFHEDEWERKRLRGGDSCVRYDACYQRIDDTDRFHLVWKHGDEKSPIAETGGNVTVTPAGESTEPALGPYPSKCLKCDGLSPFHWRGCHDPSPPEPEPRQTDPLVTTREPVGATWEKFRL